MKKKGIITLPTIIIFSLILITAIVGFLTSGFIESLISSYGISTRESFYLAESGSEDALLKIARNKNLPPADWYLPQPKLGETAVAVDYITTTEIEIFSSALIFQRPRFFKTIAEISSDGLISNVSFSEKSRFWYNSSWRYRKKIKIDHRQVETSLKDFPILISIIDSDLKKYAQPDGSDIIFTKFDGITKLKREIEKYASSTGELISWVKIPYLSSTSDTEIYLYFGNPDASESNDTEVWSNGFEGVWHLAEFAEGTGSSDIYKDSTSNQNHGDDYVSAVGKEGKIGFGQEFDGIDDYLDFGDVLDVGINSFTLEAWVKTDILDSDWHHIISKNQASFPNYQLMINPENRFQFSAEYQSGEIDDVVANLTLSEGTWYHLVGVRDTTNCKLKIYVNGILKGEITPTTCAGNLDNTQPFKIGMGTTSLFWDGVVDEVRIYSRVLSEEEIKLNYQNQNSPNSFYQIGFLETY